MLAGQSIYHLVFQYANWKIIQRTLLILLVNNPYLCAGFHCPKKLLASLVVNVTALLLAQNHIVHTLFEIKENANFIDRIVQKS